MLHDKDIREPLFEFLEDTYGTVRIIEEKTMGRSRADVVMVTADSLIGIEIKSDADTYERLASQVKDYDKYFDYNLVAVGSVHAGHIKEHVPEHWGIITVDEVEGEADFYFLRKPLPNTKNSWKRKLSLLWRPELAKLLEWNSMPKYKEKSRDFVAEKLEAAAGDKIPEGMLREQVSRILMERDYTTVEEELKEYRKSETRKKLEQETDLSKQIELVLKAAEQRERLKKVRPARRRRKKT